MATCKDCIHYKMCNDYVYLIGREDKVACPDFVSTEDVVPRSLLNVYKREVEELTEERDKYKKYYFRHEYDQWEAEIKQEVAKQIFEEIEKDLNSLIAYYKEKRKYVTEVEYNEFEQLFCDIKIRTFEERLLKIAELKRNT